MSGVDDYPYVRHTRSELDDALIEALLRGEQVPRELHPLASVLQAIQASGLAPVQPSAELTERMARGDFSDVPVSQRSLIGRAAQRLARLSLRAKIASVLAIGVTGVSGVTAAGALPDAAQQRVENVVEAVTPLEFADTSNFGQDVADDAQDGGANGAEISEEAKNNGRGNPSEAPAPKPTPPVTLPSVVPTNPPHDTPRSGPAATPPLDPPGRDATKKPDKPGRDIAPDDPKNNGARNGASN
jgi:hypothetical protein